MKITIIKSNGQKEGHDLVRLVTTVGYGSQCDIILGDSDSTKRLGMFIRQEEKINFKPLFTDGEVKLNGLPLMEMIECEQGSELDFGPCKILFQEHQIETTRLYPPPAASSRPSAPVPPLSVNRNTALHAYGKESTYKETPPTSPPASPPEVPVPVQNQPITAYTPPVAPTPTPLPLPVQKEKVIQGLEESSPQRTELDREQLLRDLRRGLDENWLEEQEHESDRFADFKVRLQKALSYQSLATYPDEQSIKEIYKRLSKPGVLLNIFDTDECKECFIMADGKVRLSNGRGKSEIQFKFENAYHIVWELSQFLKQRGGQLERGNRLYKHTLKSGINLSYRVPKGSLQELAIKIRYPIEATMQNLIEQKLITASQREILQVLFEHRRRLLIAAEPGISMDTAISAFMSHCSRMGQVILYGDFSELQSLPLGVIRLSAQKDTQVLQAACDFYEPMLLIINSSDLAKDGVLKVLLDRPIGLIATQSIRPGEDALSAFRLKIDTVTSESIDRASLFEDMLEWRINDGEELSSKVVHLKNKTERDAAPLSSHKEEKKSEVQALKSSSKETKQDDPPSATKSWLGEVEA